MTSLNVHKCDKTTLVFSDWLLYQYPVVKIHLTAVYITMQHFPLTMFVFFQNECLHFYFKHWMQQNTVFNLYMLSKNVTLTAWKDAKNTLEWTKRLNAHTVLTIAIPIMPNPQRSNITEHVHYALIYTSVLKNFSNVISAAAPGRAPLVPAGLSCQGEGALATYVSLMPISSLFHLGTYCSS